MLFAPFASGRFQMAGIVRLDRDEAGQWEVRWVFPPELVPLR